MRLDAAPGEQRLQRVARRRSAHFFIKQLQGIERTCGEIRGFLRRNKV
jgi:hypothetical protein